MPAEHFDLTTLPGRGRVIVAFSGGPDSVCLLYRLTRAALERGIECVHIDHGLDPESAQRANRAVAIADGLGVPCRIIRIEVSAGSGPEAAARDARYRALEALVGPGEVLVTAHHADDQVETVLLRLIRGAGPEGLSGIPALRRFARGWLARPLLDCTRAGIEHCIERNGLDCIRDPANECLDFDRNQLRHKVLPGLRRRWPGVETALRRSARLCGDAAGFIRRHVEADLAAAYGPRDVLALDGLADDSHYYRAETIRSWCLHNGCEPPPGRRLDTFVEQLRSARSDRCPELRWSGRVLRFWRGRVWLESALTPADPWSLRWDGRQPIELPHGLGRMELTGSGKAPRGLEIRSGREGESLRPAGDAHHRACKRLLAAAGIPPWRRHQWPRLWLDGRLVALGAHWLTAEFEALLRRRRLSLHWHGDAHRASMPVR